MACLVKKQLFSVFCHFSMARGLLSLLLFSCCNNNNMNNHYSIMVQGFSVTPQQQRQQKSFYHHRTTTPPPSPPSLLLLQQRQQQQQPSVLSFGSTRFPTKNIQPNILLYNTKNNYDNTNNDNEEKDFEIETDNNNWMDLTESQNGGVLKQILKEGKDKEEEEECNNENADNLVSILYTGTIFKYNNNNNDENENESNDYCWKTSQEVIDCWLLQQQGLEYLVDGFVKYDITETKLVDTETTFTEEFVRDTLGVENKITCKKIVMAAKRLRKARDEFSHGTIFDSKNSEDSYKFVLGAGKVIRGMDIGVSSMKCGEIANILIRSDYAYGSEGYRKSNGDVMIPPFATLLFQVERQ